MTEKELLAQVLNREIGNLLGTVNPMFRMFSSNITNSLMNFLEPYLTAFTDPDTNKLNTKAAEAYLKQETSEKISAFMKQFNNEINPNV